MDKKKWAVTVYYGRNVTFAICWTMAFFQVFFGPKYPAIYGSTHSSGYVLVEFLLMVPLVVLTVASQILSKGKRPE